MWKNAGKKNIFVRGWDDAALIPLLNLSCHYMRLEPNHAYLSFPNHDPPIRSIPSNPSKDHQTPITTLPIPNLYFH
ncbi:hypothetical protein DSO57_1015363 [Entomophthora muscae]|uniref:Uncharacterized protein n=1 Tax=Entomophthora muscae TaxID=34485 RepID=A0ACC2S772_9FUNG|nr:hypothetical protein DSO57_1015363 [Entomophthora muscae]